jgi:hypothetical protein
LAPEHPAMTTANAATTARETRTRTSFDLITRRRGHLSPEPFVLTLASTSQRARPHGA